MTQAHVDVYVFWLRAKVEPDPANPVHLLTVRGSGYLFEATPGLPTTQRTLTNRQHRVKRVFRPSLSVVGSRNPSTRP
jgi:hypothetical protein